MKTTVYRSEFHDYFTRSDTYKNQFSYEARELIYDYIEYYERDCGEEIEFDLVGICCDFSESHYSDIIGDYETDISEALGDDCIDEDAKIEYVKNWLQDNTMLVGEHSNGVFVFQQF